MEVSKWPLMATFALLISGFAQDSAVAGIVGAQEDCGRNCVSITRYWSTLLVVARNAEGEVFKTLSFELPYRARLINSDNKVNSRGGPGVSGSGSPAGTAFSVPVGTQCYGMQGVCTETSVITYSTPTQYVFYTFTYVFKDGDLIDVRVDETRVARAKLD